MQKTLLFFFFSITLVSAQNFTVDNINYSIISATEVQVGLNTNYSGSLVIPSTVNDGNTLYNVTAIGTGAFLMCTGLTSLVIPDSVTVIGNAAFYYCTGLTSVVIPNSVTVIEDYTFYYCAGLTSVVIPDSVTTIGNNAFSNCFGLTSAVIPDSVTTIGNNAFSNCQGLTSLVIPNSVTAIEDYAFSYCQGLTSLVIPDSVTVIGDSAFLYCTSLESIVCEIEIPLTIVPSVFNYINKATCDLKVPAASINDYKAKYVWKEFNISPITTLNNPVFSNKNNTTIYPNPATDLVTIDLGEDVKLEKVTIYNTLGQLIKTENKNVIAVNSLSQGTYFFEVVTDKGKETKTVLVQ